MADLPGDRISQTAAATPVDDGALGLSEEMAVITQEFIRAVEAVAAGRESESAVSLLLIHSGLLAAAGARLGALTDIVPEGSYEPDTGMEPDLSELQAALAGVLGEADAYRAVDDPYFPVPEIVESTLSADLVQIVSDLLHGLAHFAAGRPVEALWWWQYAYLSSWGECVLNIQVALRSLIAHVRLDLEANAG